MKRSLLVGEIVWQVLGEESCICTLNNWTYICMYVYMHGKVFLDIKQKYKLFYKDRHHQDLTQISGISHVKTVKITSKSNVYGDGNILKLLFVYIKLK